MQHDAFAVRPLNLLLTGLLIAVGAGATRAQGLGHGHASRARAPHDATVAQHELEELAKSAGCDPSWLPTFGSLPGVNASIEALAVFDDGSGPALYVGGGFSTANGVAGTRGLARWDGTHWSSVGGGLDGVARCLLVYDDGQGGGPALYAGGDFSMAGGVSAENIARWDGNSWSPLGGGIDNAPGSGVNALAEFDDGSGPALYAGGTFDLADGQFVRKIAKWDGQTWSGLGTGLTGQDAFDEAGWALAVFDDGTGPALYLGGHFDMISGVHADNLAKWNGTSWSEVGGGVVASTPWQEGVHCLTVLDLGGSPALYLGGYFGFIDGGVLNNIGAWDGEHWRNLGTGIPSAIVHALTGHDDGSGLKLYAGGSFSSAGGVPANQVASWNGTGWSALAGGVSGGVEAMAEFDDGGGAGPRLFVGGGLVSAGSIPVNSLGAWDGSDWAAGGVGPDAGLNKSVTALTVFDDGLGGGPALVAGGSFTTVGPVSANHVAKWNGSSWSALGEGIDGPIYCLAVYDDGRGGGPALYAGGSFGFQADPEAEPRCIARWTGTEWAPVGGGANFAVWDLEVFDDGLGGGPALYAAGDFTSAGGAPGTQYIAKWDGVAWSTLSGTGISGPYQPPLSPPFLWTDTLAVFDDGQGGGPALYVGGMFNKAGGVSASRIAKWDGQSWSALGSGIEPGYKYADDLAVFDDGAGGGPALYMSGLFSTVGGVAAESVARWDGTSWSALGSGVDSGESLCLAVYDEGTGNGPALFVGGVSESAGGAPVNWIARWNGASWSALDAGVDDWVGAMTAADLSGTDGPALYVGGSFIDAGGTGDSYLARWSGCPVDPSTWNFLGYALAGVDGPPVLAGGGTLVAGSPGTLKLTHAKPSALTVLFVSLAGIPAHFKCGTLVPVPVTLQVQLFTNGAGQLPLGWGAWPGGLSGFSLFFQYAVLDPAAICGVALSNALRADVP